MPLRMMRAAYPGLHDLDLRLAVERMEKNVAQATELISAGCELPSACASKFTASVTLVGGKPVISYSPEFADEAEAAKRVYTTYGKKSLLDTEWTKVAAGDEANFNFFKVTVEMK